MGIEFVIPTYNRTELLFTIVCSILAQTNPNWKIHIVGDDIPQENLDRLNSFLNLIDDDRIKFTNLRNRYNDWGHTPRNYGVEHATEEWTIMTGEDNYYVPTFVENMLNMGKDKHFVFCLMVHNWVDDNYIPIDCKVEYGKIDIGCFMVKTNMGKKIKLDTTFAQSDWKYVEDYFKKYPAAKIGKVNKVLYVHN